MRPSVLTALVLLLAGTASASAQHPTVDFVTEILPILESRCIECHQAPRRLANGRMKRPKGRVRFDSVEAIRASKRGNLIVPGKPDESIALDVISLPADHDDRMPPASKGALLSEVDVERIKRWISQGARFGNWTNVVKIPATSNGVESISPPSKALPPITALAFTPDGKLVVAASQRGLQVLQWPELTVARTISIKTPNLHDLAFSPAGDRIAIGGGDPSEAGLVELVSWPRGESVRQVGDHHDSVFASAFRDDSQLLSGGLDKRIVLWDLQAGTAIRDFKGHSRGVTALCWLPDKETFVSGSLDHSLRVWNANTGELIRSLSQHTGSIHALALQPSTEGLPIVASSASDRTIRFWQPTIGRMVRYVRLPSAALSIAWIGEETIVASCRDGKLRVINTFTLRIERELAAVAKLGYSLALHPTDGSVAVGGLNGEIRRIIVRQEKR
jgi:WD40 repeat protein